MKTSETLPDVVQLAEDLLPSRLRSLQDALASRGCLYLLVDPMLGDPVLGLEPPENATLEELDSLRSDAWERPVYGLGLPEGVALRPNQAPYIVSLFGADDPWIQTSVLWALMETFESRSGGLRGSGSASFRMGAWIETETSTDGSLLARQLSCWLKLRTQRSTGARYLRLADRRVWGLCLHVLGEQTVAAHLGHVRRWHWLDHHQSWQSLTGTTLAEPTAVIESPLPAFSPAQWAVMSRGSELHMAISCMQGQRWLDQALGRLRDAANEREPVYISHWREALQALEAVDAMRAQPRWQQHLITSSDVSKACALTLLWPQWVQQLAQPSTRFQGSVADWAYELYASMTA